MAYFYHILGSAILVGTLVACGGGSSDDDGDTSDAGTEYSAAGVLCDYSDTTYNNQASLTEESTSQVLMMI